MGVITVANRKIEVPPGRQNMLEATLNNKGRKLIPNPVWDRIILDKDESGKFRLTKIPNALLRIQQWLTATAAVIGDKGRRLGDVETTYEYAGIMREIIYRPTKKQKSFGPDTLFMCDQGFALFDEKNQPITKENIHEITRLFAKFNGEVYLRQIQNRAGGEFEKVGDESTWSYISDSAILGLLARVRGGGGRRVVLFNGPSFRFGVAAESP